jgi:hypothetical protein
MRDLHNNIHMKRAISPAAAGTDNTPIVSQILDTAGFGSAELVILLGANTDTDATFAVLLEHDDAAGFGTAEAVADGYLLGTEALAGFTAAEDDNKVKKLGYIGPKRYLRATITPTGNNSGNIFVAAVWLLGHPQSAPTPNPPT